MHTPDFPAWRARFAACGRRLHSLRSASLPRLDLLLGSFFPAHLLSPTEEGANSRQRIFSLRHTFFAFLYQVLHPGSACRTAVRQVQALFQQQGGGWVDAGTGAYCQARKRLPLDTLQRVRHAVAAQAERLLPPSQQSWYGLHPKVIDGTSVSAPDTPSNQRAYPQYRTQKPGCGFPVLKLLGVFSLASGVLLDYATGNKHQHELRLLLRLLDWFKLGDLALADRGFCSYWLMALLWQRQVQSLFRLHQSRSADLRQGRRLGPRDRLLTWCKPKLKPHYFPNTLYKRLPDALSVRVLHFQLRVPGFRPGVVTLVTTLTDPDRYPAQALAQLYARRWRIELWFRDIKTTLGMETLRCRSPRMLHKELEMFLIAYNLLRALGLTAAVRAAVPPERMSFKGTVDAVDQYSLAISQTRSPKRQQALVDDLLRVLAADLVPERPGRREPRAVKRRPKSFDLLNKPRHQFKDTPHRNRCRKGDNPDSQRR
jgi:hypothetical protein